MSMQVIERYIVAKTGQLQTCEDAIYINEHFACVVDGATSKSSWAFPEQRTGGWWAAAIVVSVVERLAAEATVEEFIAIATQQIADFYHRHQHSDRAEQSPHERMAASIVMFSRFHRQIWMIGDCQCLIDGQKYTNPKLVDTILSEARALFLTAELQAGKTVEDLMAVDSGRAFILPLLERQSRFQNAAGETPYAFAALDGFAIDIKLVRQIQVREDATQIVLASDGYPDLAPTLAESEARLQATIANDPLCITENKSTKGMQRDCIAYDDRAYLSILL